MVRDLSVLRQCKRSFTFGRPPRTLNTTDVGPAQLPRFMPSRAKEKNT